ncbi:MAG: hypothetical protein CM15mP117_13660 [Alphaproteobacteria bacterium]|nr:MAG: hypothetical protein CM15mP117_13660 [Alphaproteobacteria bacterium]
MTLIFKPKARLATIAPIFPHPIMPSLLVISVPINLDFSHLLEIVEICAWGIWRVSDNIIAIACSAVVIAFPKVYS